MGACDFYILGSGPSLKKAFQQAVDDAKYESGHGGYTGTIAEKHEVVLVGKADNVEEAFEKAYDLVDDPKVSDKWGPAGAVHISDTEKYVFFGWASS